MPAASQSIRVTSTELTGGEGFTYEDTVVAYYLSALLRAGGAAGSVGFVTRVAVQQRRLGEALDDLIVTFDQDGENRRLSLQVKTAVRISAADTNSDFREIIEGSLATLSRGGFQADRDSFGFAGEPTSAGTFSSLERLISSARSSPTEKDFTDRLQPGVLAADLKAVLLDLRQMIGEAREWDFYRHFVAFNPQGLRKGQPLYAEVANGLQAISAEESPTRGEALFTILCRLAREGAGQARVWTRPSLLSEVSAIHRLAPAHRYAADLQRLSALARSSLHEIGEEVGETHIPRPVLVDNVQKELSKRRVVNIAGLPGCGKSALLRKLIDAELAAGPVLFLKSDRLVGVDWQTFAVGLGLSNHDPLPLLAEIGATGAPILYIDGVDRIPAQQRSVVIDLIRTIQESKDLENWKVLLTSRDQGLEPFRTWFPSKIYEAGGIGDVPVSEFDSKEASELAEKYPPLRPLLFGAPAVREIARRPFFASILARALTATEDDEVVPRSETDLIASWWRRGGYRVAIDQAPTRQRALEQLASVGVRTIGRNIPAQDLNDATVGQLGGLVEDGIVTTRNDGATYSFCHDIFFEWSYLRLLMASADWKATLTAAGQPPLLGRVVTLLSENTFRDDDLWRSTYRHLMAGNLRPQWRRAWLLGPPTNPSFAGRALSFGQFLAENEHQLLQKFIVWFQAESTSPSPLILGSEALSLTNSDRVRLADLYGWPSDFPMWGRVIDWLTDIASEIPVRLYPQVLEVFTVWQNALSAIRDPRSIAMAELTDKWLQRIEAVDYGDAPNGADDDWAAMGHDGRKAFESQLRVFIVRSARASPEVVGAMLDRAIENGRLRSRQYKSLVAMSGMLAADYAAKLAELVRREIFEPLPREKLSNERREREERTEWIAALRAKPDAELTTAERRSLELAPLSIMRGASLDHDDLGIGRYGQNYHPVSPIEEPFRSLLQHAPDVGLALIKEIADRATEGWKQLHDLRVLEGTPVPVTLAFPWGAQTFWGDWTQYSWAWGELGPPGLECAFSALFYWAHKQLEAGASCDDLIERIVSGSHSYGMLAVAATLAIESQSASVVTLPLATCQRVWHDDIKRVMQPDPRSVTLRGFEFAKPKFNAAQTEALDFLKSRKSRKADIRVLSYNFALSADDTIRLRYKAALEQFPADLPFRYEEEKGPDGLSDFYRESAENWSRFGDRENFEAKADPDGAVVISVTPGPVRPDLQALADRANQRLRMYSTLGSCQASLAENRKVDDLDLDSAFSLLHPIDNAQLFKRLAQSEDAVPQSAVSALAACIVRFAGPDHGARPWALDVLSRVAVMEEQVDIYGGMPTAHPVMHLLASFVGDIHSSSPAPKTIESILKLVAHPNPEISKSALLVLLLAPEAETQWLGGTLASELFQQVRHDRTDDGSRDSVAQNKRQQTLVSAAIADWKEGRPRRLLPIPPTWVKAGTRSRGRSADDAWEEPLLHFATQLAEEVVPHFPIELWAGSERKDETLGYLKQLAKWTSEKIEPAWAGARSRHERSRRLDLHVWPAVLARAVSRACPYLTISEIESDFIKVLTFESQSGDDRIEIIGEFCQDVVARHVYDAVTVSPHTLEILDKCLSVMLAERAFNRTSYGSGEIRGLYLGQMVKALLFVSVTDAPGAVRFANGKWQDVSTVMPLVSRLLQTAGWVAFVAQQFASLCDRAGSSYPTADFLEQTQKLLSELGDRSTGWIGLMLPSRFSALVQMHAEYSAPLSDALAQGLLTVLDYLIDLGDRRAAALEQAEAFRQVRVLTG